MPVLNAASEPCTHSLWYRRGREPWRRLHAGSEASCNAEMHRRLALKQSGDWLTTAATVDPNQRAKKR
jgi:hypothetical protein